MVRKDSEKTAQSGGVGKTTTTGNLGIGLAKQGKRVLLVDADAQGSLTANVVEKLEAEGRGDLLRRHPNL